MDRAPHPHPRDPRLDATEYVPLLRLINHNNRASYRSTGELSENLWHAAILHANPGLAPALAKQEIEKAGKLLYQAATSPNASKKTRSNTLQNLKRWMAKIPERARAQREPLIAAFSAFGIDALWPTAKTPNKSKALDHAIWLAAKRNEKTPEHSPKRPRFRDGV